MCEHLAYECPSDWLSDATRAKPTSAGESFIVAAVVVIDETTRC